ncbi:MAG TPA: SpoIIE family protein phosphatase [Natronosporangium sp.]
MAEPGGSGERVARRVKLPADRRTPAAARAVVRSVLEEAKATELLDAALLLTTELSTNAVVHAGTDLELEVVADPTGLTVMVVDNARGVVAAEPPPSPPAGQPPGPPADLAERGRGLLLVDHFASRWGTTHHQHGKGVWFRLRRDGQPEPSGTDMALAGLGAPGDGTRLVADAPAVNALLSITQDPYADDPIADFAKALLTQLVDLVGAGGGVVRCDLGEGAGMTVLARYGRAPRTGVPTLRIPLGLGGNATGELEIDAPKSAHVQALAALVAERLSLTLENDRLRRTDRRRQTWLTFLAEASELLAQSLDVQLTLALIPQLVVPRLGQWSAVHTTDAWGRLKLETAAHADEQALPELYASLQETGPDSVLSRLPGAMRAGGQVPLPPPTEGFAIPLIARGQLLGTLSVGRHPQRRHEPDEIAVLQDVARRAALAVDNARIHAERRNVARTLQRSLLPPKLPSVPGIGFGAAYVPTGDAAEVGGDFYDVIQLRDDQWLVVIGDVSGKGVQAAAVTGLVREVIRALVRGGRPLPEILERINETLVERGRGRYCTLALASVRPVDERLEVVLHLAGHDRPVLVRADGRTGSAGSGGTALGLLDTIKCPGETLWLAPGDSLVFYTDGVTERRRGRELFGSQRLREAVAPLASYSAEVMAARLRATTIGFSAEPPRDDIALLVLRNEPAAPPIRVRAEAPVPAVKESDS